MLYYKNLGEIKKDEYFQHTGLGSGDKILAQTQTPNQSYSRIS